MFSQYLYWENNIYTMKSWINQRWWSAKASYYKNVVSLYATSQAGFAMGVLKTECSIHHSYSLFIFLLTDHRQNTAQTSEYADRHNDCILAKQEGKCCHSMSVEKYYPRVTQFFTRYAALKGLSCFHIKIQISWDPACRFYLLSVCRTRLRSSFLKLLQTKHPVSALHTLSQAFELSQLPDHWRRYQNYSWSTILEYNFF